MTESTSLPPVSVVSGGPGEEREISLASGENVARALEEAGLSVRRIVIEDTLDPSQENVRGTVVFLALHGRYGEDGTVQELLESAGIPYTGSGPEASRRAFHKPTAKRLFEAAGIRTPKYQLVGSGSVTGTRKGPFRVPTWGPPLVVKPASSGSSVGVRIVRRAGELEAAVRQAQAASGGAEIILEKFIPGRELSVGVLEKDALPPVELRPAREFFDYEAKYLDERTEVLCPAPLGPVNERAAQAAALAAFGALGARDFARVDMILSEDGEPYVLELNTIPGLTEHSLLPKETEAAGISFPELCVRLVEAAAPRAAQGGEA